MTSACFNQHEWSDWGIQLLKTLQCQVFLLLDFTKCSKRSWSLEHSISVSKETESAKDPTSRLKGKTLTKRAKMARSYGNLRVCVPHNVKKASSTETYSYPCAFLAAPVIFRESARIKYNSENLERFGGRNQVSESFHRYNTSLIFQINNSHSCVINILQFRCKSFPVLWQNAGESLCWDATYHVIYCDFLVWPCHCQLAISVEIHCSTGCVHLEINSSLL